MQEKCINSRLLFLENVIEYNTELNFYAEYIAKGRDWIMKKKLLSALLVATCVVSMAACGSNKT